jgi:phage-related protein
MRSVLDNIPELHQFLIIRRRKSLNNVESSFPFFLTDPQGLLRNQVTNINSPLREHNGGLKLEETKDERAAAGVKSASWNRDLKGTYHTG